MDIRGKVPSSASPPPFYVVSCGAAIIGEQLLNAALVQFKENNVPIIRAGHMRHLEQIQDVIDRAVETGGTILHSLVDTKLRGALIRLGIEKGVVTIDFIGPLLEHLTVVLGEEPVGQPGLYWKLRQVDHKRVAAIEFSIDHDDGMKPEDLNEAEIVLAGVSRAGKTPLSMYMATLGWKVANVPFVFGLPLPKELFQVDRRRVFGLIIRTDQLLVHRRKRRGHLDTKRPSPYTDKAIIHKEVESANRLFRRHGFTLIGVSDKPIETSADEIIELIDYRFGDKARKG